VDYLKSKLSEEDVSEQVRILKYPLKFTGFYNAYAHTMEVDIGNKLHTMMFDSAPVDIAMAEIKASFTPYIAKNLFEYLAKVNKS